MSFTKEQLREQMLLYAVTDRHWLNGQTLYEQVEEALKGGATFIQLREKDLTEEEFLEEAKKIQQLCKKYRVPFIINDNVKLAKEIDADGVHVGQSDMEALDVRAQLGEDKIIGVSARRTGDSGRKARGRLSGGWSGVSNRNKNRRTGSRTQCVEGNLY